MFSKKRLSVKVEVAYIRKEKGRQVVTRKKNPTHVYFWYLSQTSR